MTPRCQRTHWRKAISIKISLALAPVTAMSNNGEKEHFWCAGYCIYFWYWLNRNTGSNSIILDSSLWKDCIYPAVTTEPISPVLERRLLHNISSFWCLLKRGMHLLDGTSFSPVIKVLQDILLCFSAFNFQVLLNVMLIYSLQISTDTFWSYLFACLCSFYRFVLESDVAFMANDTVSAGPVARFMELPESPLLTLNMITPESWMVQAMRSPYDLDNIHLQEVTCSLVIAT